MGLHQVLHNLLGKYQVALALIPSGALRVCRLTAAWLLLVVHKPSFGDNVAVPEWLALWLVGLNMLGLHIGYACSDAFLCTSRTSWLSLAAQSALVICMCGGPKRYVRSPPQITADPQAG